MLTLKPVQLGGSHAGIVSTLGVCIIVLFLSVSIIWYSDGFCFIYLIPHGVLCTCDPLTHQSQVQARSLGTSRDVNAKQGLALA